MATVLNKQKNIRFSLVKTEFVSVSHPIATYLSIEKINYKHPPSLKESIVYIGTTFNENLFQMNNNNINYPLQYRIYPHIEHNIIIKSTRRVLRNHIIILQYR